MNISKKQAKQAIKDNKEIIDDKNRDLVFRAKDLNFRQRNQIKAQIKNRETVIKSLEKYLE